MKENVVLYSEVKRKIQNILKQEHYEQVLMQLTDKLIKKKNVSDIPEVEEYEIRIYIDCLKECKIQREQQPILNMLVGKLETSLTM